MTLEEILALGRLPLIALRSEHCRGMVIPRTTKHLNIGRDASVASLQRALADHQYMICVTQRDSKQDDPSFEDLYPRATLVLIRSTSDQAQITTQVPVKVIAVGQALIELTEVTVEDGVQWGSFKAVNFDIDPSERQVINSLTRQIRYEAKQYLELKERSPQKRQALNPDHYKDKEPIELAYAVLAQLDSLSVEMVQQILSKDQIQHLLTALLHHLKKESQQLHHRKRSDQRSRGGSPEDPMKDASLEESVKSELEELEAKVQEKDLPENAREKVEKELRKLKMMSPMGAEATIVRNYIEWILSLPWNHCSEDKTDINAAEEILNSEHYALKKPKERILEHLAVHSLTQNLSGPILCLVGPPGVGKTSLVRSIATSMGREFVRMSLGGVRDEAEIRGHRRTYIGAMPGKIIQSLRKVGTNNPVLLLDEIDKMSTDFRGDPSSALLEVLDPEQNTTFNDHYVDLDYDLSKVMFITTANNRHQIPLPLQDRLEMIEVSGYTEVEKLNIIKRHLLPKQLKRHGIEEAKITWLDSALRLVVNRYTRESGVRNLERQVAAICRKIAREVISSQNEGGVIEEFTYRVDSRKVQKLLGAPPYNFGVSDVGDAIGLVNGLAYTSWGGNLLQAEVTVMEGAGKLTITGQLGEVMQESARAAMSYVRSRAQELGLEPKFHQGLDFHLHFPEGAIPKDGPSAGVTMVTGLVSAIKGMPVRRDIAMTGEITLRGRVLPIGGLKEKLLAAKRGGIKTVFIPKDNLKDLEEVPASVRRALEVVGVDIVDEILERAYHSSPFVDAADTSDAPTTTESAESSVESPAKQSTPKKKSTAKKSPAKKSAAKKSAAKKSAAKNSAAKKSPAKKSPAKKSPAKKSPAKKSPVKKSPAKKSPAKKNTAKKTTKKKS